MPLLYALPITLAVVGTIAVTLLVVEVIVPALLLQDPHQDRGRRGRQRRRRPVLVQASTRVQDQGEGIVSTRVAARSTEDYGYEIRKRRPAANRRQQQQQQVRAQSRVGSLYIADSRTQLYIQIASRSRPGASRPRRSDGVRVRTRQRRFVIKPRYEPFSSSALSFFRHRNRRRKDGRPEAAPPPLRRRRRRRGARCCCWWRWRQAGPVPPRTGRHNASRRIVGCCCTPGPLERSRPRAGRRRRIGRTRRGSRRHLLLLF